MNSLGRRREETTGRLSALTTEDEDPKMRNRVKPFGAALLWLLWTAGCSTDEGLSPVPIPTEMLPTSLSATVTNTRFLTADHMLASIEMQISGEPFAELLGRDIAGYDRFGATTDKYIDPTTGEPTVDKLGFSLAIESYEYSKQSMNNVSFEAGAGLSLQFGPLLNPTGTEGTAAYQLLLDRLQYLGKASRASGAKFGKDFVTSPAPVDDPNNAYGWPGFWPTFAEFRSFDPAITPAVGADKQCSLAGATDEPVPPDTVVAFVGDYECDYNTLNLPNRDTQVDKVLEPDALGYAAWKQMLWVINYWASLHDVGQNPITVVPLAQLPNVGQPDNTVIGQFPSPLDPEGEELVFGKDGTFLGGVSLEGFQGLVMLDELDNKSALLLKGLLTADGQKLGGVATVKEAIDYDYATELMWWPSQVGVTEAATTPLATEATRYFPKPTAFSIKAAESRLQDLSALLGGFATLYAFTDESNAELGGALPSLATFDGSPFAADNQLPDGEDSPHDRALAIVKMALVNLDRIHFDAKNAVLVDTATPGASVKRGSFVSTFQTAYSIVALRTALRGLSASLTLYSNDTPDAQGAPIPLDQTKLDGAPFQGAFGARVVALIRAQADFLSNKLLHEDGLADNGYDVAAGSPDSSPTTLEAQASAIRGLLEAYLATSEERYRQRAAEAYAALEKQFWMDDVRLFRTTLGESSRMIYSPRSFGALHGALRQYWKLVANRPGQEQAAEAVLARIERGMKLVVNGWDDVNQDGMVQPNECLSGRLQMAERALTGDFSIAADQGDRDHDCVPDIATKGLPAALAAELLIERK
jgi:hypothetical protein